jgi:hypothetical protein
MPINGRICLGINGINYFSGFFAFINIWKQGSVIEINAPTGGGGSNQQWLSTTQRGGTLSPWGVYLNDDGEMIAPVPTVVTSLNRVFAAGTSNFLGESWVLKFDGTVGFVNITGASNVVRVGNRITWTWNSSGNLSVSFSTITQADPPRNIRICRLSNEDRLDAGELFEPQWLTAVLHGSGICRFMDWQGTNGNRANVSYASIPTSTSFTELQGTTTNTANRPAGMPLAIPVALCSQVGSHAWVSIPHVFGTMKGGNVSAITLASPAVATDLGHTYVNGEEIFLHGTGTMTKTATVTFDTTSDLVNWMAHGFPAGARVTFTGGTLPTGITSGTAYFVLSSGLTADNFKVATIRGGSAINLGGSPSGTTTGQHGISRQKFTVSNVVAGVSYELTGWDSSGHTALSASGCYSTKPINLANITTEVTSFAGYFRDNMPATLKTFFELSNEQWNPGFTQFEWYEMQAGDYFPAENGSKLHGYISAHCMAAIRAAYTDRTKWVGIIATQTGNSGVINAKLSGIQQYITDLVPTLSITDLFDHIAVTSYYGSNMMKLANQATVMGWTDTSETRWNSGLEATKYAYFNRTLNANLYDASILSFTDPITVVETFWDTHKTIADTNGLGLVQYEGGRSDFLSFSGGFYGSLSASDKARILEFYRESSHTVEDAANYAIIFNSFVAKGGVYPSKFVEMGIVSEFGNFGGLRSLTDSNPVWDGVVDFNTPPGDVLRRRMRLTATT